MSNTKIISIINWKGGVGKTTITHHLATGLQEFNLNTLKQYIEIEASPKILLIDMDAQCNLSISCLKDDVFERMVYKDKIGTIKDLFEIFLVNENSDCDINKYILKGKVRSSEGMVYKYIDLLPSHPDLIYTDMNIARYSSPNFNNNFINSDVYKFRIVNNILSKVKADYDFIIIDCPPNLNFITQNALYVSDYYLIPTIPDKLSSYGILSITNKVKQLNSSFSSNSKDYAETKLLGIIPNNIREYAEEPKQSQSNILSTLRDIFGESVFKNYLTYGDGIPLASSQGYPVFALENSHQNASKQSSLLKDIITECLLKIQKGA